MDARRVVQRIRRLAEETEDVLPLYFVGHGTVLPKGQLCLTLSDTDAADPDLTGIEYDRIRDILIRSPAQVKITILDCCHSGRAIEALAPAAGIADATDTEGTYTLTASDHLAHVPPPDRQARECTSFTGELIKVIREGMPGDAPALTLNEIYRHLKLRLVRGGFPAPNQRGTDTVGHFAFSLNAGRYAGTVRREPRCTLDIAFCVDTGSEMASALSKVREAMLAICRRVAAESGRNGLPVIRQRIRLISFR